MPTGTPTLCTQVDQFSSKNVNLNVIGIMGTGAIGTTNNIDLKMLDDNYLTGVAVLVKNATYGDYCTMQVVDVDNVLGYGANTVLNQFVTKYYMSDADVRQGEMNVNYPAKVQAGLYLRAIYKSVAQNTMGMPPVCAFNYYLHKALAVTV